MAALKEIFKISKGKKEEETENESKLSRRYIQIEDLRHNDNLKYCIPNKKSVYVNKHDLIIAWDGANAGTIGVGLEGVIGSTLARLELKNNKVNPYYAARFLQSKFQYLRDNCTGATIPHISKTVLENLSIPLPPLETQKKIVEVLDKAQGLINGRKEQIRLMNELIQSVFYEMFGDPVTNPKEWEEVSIKKTLGGKTSNGFFAKRDDYCDDGNVEVLGVANIVNRMYSDVDDLLSTNANSKDIEKYEVKYGDILFCRSSLVAAGIGKASIVPINVPENILFECHVIRLQLDITKCVPEYLQILTTTPYFRNQVLKHAKTSTMTTIGQEGILSSMILLPPMEQQNKFLDFIKQIEKLKFELKRSLDKKQILFDSLMQKYFE